MAALDETRRAELVSSLGAVRSRIADACAAVGRDPRSVVLVAVTKTYPATDVATLARLGVFDIGESKDQEARAKIRELAATPDSPDVRWHLVGRLQTNKARSAVGYAHAVHSVDRAKLVRALADAALAEARSHPLGVFAQVSLDGDPKRGGVAAADLPALADTIAARSELHLLGLMCVPPMQSDPDAAFAQVQDLSARLRADHPGAAAISAGMSADLESAIRNGATHVRVGTALLGRRPPNFS